MDKNSINNLSPEQERRLQERIEELMKAAEPTPEEPVAQPEADEAPAEGEVKAPEKKKINKSLKTLLVIGIIIVVLIVAVIIVNAVQTSKKEAEQEALEESLETTEESAAVTVQERDKQDIDSFSLVKSDGTEMAFELDRAEYAWVLTTEDGVSLSQSTIDEIAYSIAELNADKIVDTNPEDLSSYGLDEPQVVVTANYNNGDKIVIRVGNLAANNTTYYAMVDGDENVYTIWSRHAEHFLYTIDDVRTTNLVSSSFDSTDLQGYIVSGRDRKTVSIELMDVYDRDDIAPDLALHIYKMTEPYEQDRGVLLSINEDYWEDLPDFAVLGTVKDNCTEEELAEYGLATDDPVMEYFVWDSSANGIHMYIGDVADEAGYLTYFRKYGDTTVYTCYTSSLYLIQKTAFEMTDKFLLMPLIKNVPSMEVTYKGEKYDLDIVATPTGDGETTADYTYDVTMNGETVDSELYRTFYSAFIATYVDAEMNDEDFEPGTADLKIRVSVYNDAGTLYEYSIDYIPYDNDFYAIRFNGAIEFLMSKKQVNKMMEAFERIG